MYIQHSLFNTSSKQESIPSFIKTVLEDGADLAVSVSGGKESDAILRFLSTQHRENDWQGDLFELFCDQKQWDTSPVFLGWLFES